MAELLTPTVIRTYKYRLLPNKRQHADLRRILEDQRQLYNAALESRISYYAKTGKSMTYFGQCKELAELRKYADFGNTPSDLQRATLKRLDRSYRAFFRRLRKGGKVGFPRFKGRGWWDSFGFNEWSGIRFDGKRIRFKGLAGGLRVHLHRPLPEGKILSCQFGRDTKGWHICFQLRIKAKLFLSAGKNIGLDMGLSSLASTSTGHSIPNIRAAERHHFDMRRRQRHMSRCVKGSNGRSKARERVARLHTKIRNTRRTYLHQVSAKLIRENDLIAIENLNIKGLAAGTLAKSIYDAGWATLNEFLAYKAESAGRQLIKVDPRNTTQACSGCGVIVPKDLNQRWHECPDCGLSLDRDVNAARNILARAVVRPQIDKLPTLVT